MTQAHGMSSPRRLTPFTLLLLIVILAAPLLRYTPLSGSVFALVWVAAAQVLVPGYLLARLLMRSEHPISQFAAALLCGIAMTVIFGAVARLIGLPVSAYLIAYAVGTAGTLVVLSLRGRIGAVDSTATKSANAKWTLRRWLPHALLALCCLIVFAVATIRSQFRFRGYADQTEFIAIADWLANEPDDPFVYSRRLGVFLDGTHDVRFETDGWTYTHAAWVWGSGVPATDLLWYALTPLFAWSIPLAYFALGYAASRRVSVGVFSAAGVMLFGLLTLDALVYNPTNLAFGQFALFQLNTARTFSLALVLPLAIFAALDYLRSPSRRGLLLIGMGGLALALLHPMQVVIFQLTIGATAGLWWLLKLRERLKAAFALLGVLLLLLTVPLMQRAGVDRLVAVEGSARQFENEGLAQNANQWGLLLINIPVLGETYIANPQSVFYHPLVLVGAGIGLLALFFIRRKGETNLLALYLFAATLAALLVLFTPGIAALVGQFVVPRYLARFVFALPVGVALGWVGAVAAMWLSNLNKDSVSGRGDLSRHTHQVKRYWSFLTPPPSPLPISQASLRTAAHGEGESSPLSMRNEMGRGFRGGVRINQTLKPYFDVYNLSGRLYRTWMPAMAMIALLFVLLLEPIPLIPASAHDQIYASEQMQRTRDIQPFDAALLDALGAVLPPDQRSNILAPIGVDSLIIESIPNTFITGGRIQLNTRTYLPTQRFFDPRLPWLDATDIAFLVEYGVTHVIVEADDTRLPQLIMDTRRFELLATPAGFYVFGIVDSLAASQSDRLFAEMNTLYADAESPRWENGQFYVARAGDPLRWADTRGAWDALPAEDATVRYGMAFAALLAGDDEAALSTLRTLSAEYPQLSLPREAAAHLLRENGEPQAGAAVLVSGLSAEAESTRILAARALLTEPFMYLLDAADVDGILAVIDAAPVTWAQLATYEQDQAVRERAALLMTKGERFYSVVSAWLAEIADVHVSAQDLVWRAQIALAARDVDGALDILRPAADADWVRAKAYLHPDRWQVNVATRLYAEIGTDDTLLNIVRTAWLQDPFALLLNVSPDETAQTVVINASLSNPTGSAYPIQMVRVRVINPDATITYGEMEMEVLFEELYKTVDVHVMLPDDLPELTPAKVVLEVLHSDTVTYQTSVQDVVLNRPSAAIAPADATAGGLTFSDSILLQSYSVSVEDDTLRVGLYWQTSALLYTDYQVFVHMVDAAGEIVRQRDIAPVEGRYPTSQWRVDTLIEDVHTLSLEGLPAGEYRVRIGMYPLPDAVPLPVSPADDPRVENNTVYLYAFER